MPPRPSDIVIVNHAVGPKDSPMLRRVRALFIECSLSIGLCIGLIGCHDKPAVPAATGEAPSPAAATEPAKVQSAGLLHPGEVEALEAALTAAIAAQPALCERPVLRGTPLAGPGEESIVETLEAVESDECATVVRDGELADRTDLTPCAPAIAALRPSVSYYASGCSRFRPGKRPQGDVRAAMYLVTLVDFR